MIISGLMRDRAQDSNEIEFPYTRNMLTKKEI